MCVIVVFWYCILKSSNTPQNLETPILGSQTKKVTLIFTSLRMQLACRRVSKRDALPQWNRAIKRENLCLRCKEPKKKTQKDWGRGALRDGCEKRLDFKYSSSKAASDRTPNPITIWSYGWRGLPQESCSGLVAPRCVGMGKVWWAIVIRMRYCTGCRGGLRWNSLRHCVSLIDLCLFIYFFFTL